MKKLIVPVLLLTAAILACTINIPIPTQQATQPPVDNNPRAIIILQRTTRQPTTSPATSSRSTSILRWAAITPARPCRQSPMDRSSIRSTPW